MHYPQPPIPNPTQCNPSQTQIESRDTGNFASHNFVSSLDAAYKNFAESSCFVKLAQCRLRQKEKERERERVKEIEETFFKRMA